MGTEESVVAPMHICPGCQIFTRDVVQCRYCKTVFEPEPSFLEKLLKKLLKMFGAKNGFIIW